MIIGFLLGKFMPFSTGHMALIDYAKANCDKLIILVAALPNEPIPYKYRLKWVLSTYLDDPQVEVFGDIVSEPEFNSSDEKSIWWGKYVKERFGKIDRIFTSEDYGKVFAESVGAENWVFDKARNIVPISASMIRQKPLTYWNYLNNFAKDYFVKKIAIVGTESTGKTTMAQQLAEHYNTVWVPEKGRELIPSSNSFSMDDLKIVGVEHAKSILKYTRLANKVLFIDTELQTTKIYSEFFFNEIPKYDAWVEKANEVDLYIYLGKDAPYIDDGTRLEKKKRDQLDEEYFKTFINKKLKFFDKTKYFDYITDDVSMQASYNWRLNSVIKYIDDFINKF